MIDALGSTATALPTDARDGKLKKAAQQLEGVFVQQLYKVMRDTVPQQEGIVSGGSGEDMFTSLLDQHLAAETPKHWDTGLAAAVYRQMRRGLPAEASADASVLPSAAASLPVIAPNSAPSAL
jgi:flagellar protein FlgJ